MPWAHLGRARSCPQLAPTTTMFEGFARTELKTSGARIVAVIGGNGPAVLLMHGNPFSHVSWHKIAPRLAQEFTVVATDLRGYGDSEKPPGGADHSAYSFRAMAQDQVEVMAMLGFDRFFAAGHDRGARVLHRMCLDHPGKVERATILDIIPQHHLLNNVTRAWGIFSWHWFFNIQPYDLPERLMGADPDYFIRRKLAKTEQGLSFFDPAALAEYIRCFRDPATIHAICEDYRATFGIDLDMDTADFEAGRKISCPLLLLWGATGGVGRNHRPMEIWPRYASDIRRAAALPCGHYLSEEAADETHRELRDFFASASLDSRHVA
jgi:haloacetate dehalogenase